MKTHATNERAPAHSERQTAGAGQTAQAASPAAATLQRYQQLANNSPQAMQLKQQAQMLAVRTSTAAMRAAQLQMKAPVQQTPDEEPLQGRFGSVVQRAVKWWPTNENHTAVTGGPSDQQPGEGSYVRRDKAGPRDELRSTQGEAWAEAKASSLTFRPDNKVLFPGTTEKMPKSDGDRTYLTEAGSKKTVSIVVTHTTDPQSQVRTETGANLKVTHAHSASGNHAQVSKALKGGNHPDYKGDEESKVHYLSLTLQAGEGKGGDKEQKTRGETDTDEPGENYADDAVGHRDLSETENNVENNPALEPPIRLGPNEALFAGVAGYTNPSMFFSWRDSLAYAKYKETLEKHNGEIPIAERNELIGWMRMNKQV